MIYVLDADYSFAIARNVVEHLSDRNDLPQSIIVGIAYGGPPAYRRHRTRDYTPTHVPTGGYGPSYQAVSGGGSTFYRFISTELIPFVHREYEAGSARVLVGHSFGGLFASWVFLTDPHRFHGYVIVSPSLWYDDGMIFELEDRAAPVETPTRMFLTVGSREVNSEHDMVGDLRRFARELEERSTTNLRMQWDIAENETHNSVFPGAVSTGLRFVLDGRE